MTRLRMVVSLASGIVAATALAAVNAAAAAPSQPRTPPAPIAYTIRVPAPESQVAEIELRVPTERRDVVDLMMATWSPGFYRVEAYAAKVSELSARTEAAAPLAVDHPAPNRWRIRTDGAQTILVSYRLSCTSPSVTTNWVSQDYAVFNGAATFLTLAEPGPRPHDVTLELPAVWPRVATGLPPAPGATPGAGTARFRAADFDTLVDSPIIAGDLEERTFEVAGSRHIVSAVGARDGWDAPRAARDLEAMVREVHRFWGALPFDRYAFLIVFRRGGGGLEHMNSTLVTANAERTRTPRGYAAWLALATHEYFHAFNVKRLRPVELGPFDYDTPPKTTSLWWSEGVTSYYSTLLLARAGLTEHDAFLASISNAITQLQNAPGRLAQTLEASSLDVWNNSLSGINPGDTTVSYYVKGEIAGFLLDARIRHVTQGEKGLDDVMRLAHARYSGTRGFTAAELRATASEVAGRDLSAWFRATLASAEELDYAEAIDWFGLRLTTSPGEPDPEGQPRRIWTLSAREDASKTQRRNLRDLLASSRRRLAGGAAQ